MGTRREAAGSATMRDVAERAGVGLTTVSRALSDPDKLAPETLRRIAEAVAALDYTVNLGARSLRRRASGIILVLLRDLGNPFSAPMLKGMAEAAREGGRMLLIGETGDDATLAHSYAAQVDAGTVDGLILLDGRLPFAAGSAARARLVKAPVVALGAPVDDPAIPFVGIDDRAAAHAVAVLLADLGHRRLAHIAGPPTDGVAALRARGFAAGARDRGCGLLGKVSGDGSVASGAAAAAAILSWRERPTAVFAADDAMAIGAIQAFTAAGVSVPGEMAVVGFGDGDAAAVHTPALTTVRQPRRAMGRAAVAVLATLIDGGPPPALVTRFAHETVLRGSAAVVPPAPVPAPRVG